MKLTFVLLFLLASVFVSAPVAKAVRFMPSDKAYWEGQVPILSDKDLDKFEAAALAKDRTALNAQTIALEDIVKEAQENNKKLVPQITKLVTWINDLAQNSDKWFRPTMLRSLVVMIDGNRDNKSYYLLDAAREWIEKRLRLIGGQLQTDFRTAQNQIVDARDTLDDNAQIFVRGVKDIRKLSECPKTNDAQIKGIATKMMNAMENGKALLPKTDTAIETIQSIVTNQNEK